MTFLSNQSEIKVNYDSFKDELFVNIPIDNQTLYMALQCDDWSSDTIYINIVLGVFNKRKHLYSNENNILMTGVNPLATAIMARKAFKALEREALKMFNDNYRVIIYCSWTNNVRRDVYYKVLSKMGYRYGMLGGKKVILRTWKKGQYRKD